MQYLEALGGDHTALHHATVFSVYRKHALHSRTENRCQFVVSREFSIQIEILRFNVKKISVVARNSVHAALKRASKLLNDNV